MTIKNKEQSAKNKQKRKGKMRFVLVVTGDSAEELFAVGPKDLVNHFLKEHLFIKPKDVKECWFEKISDLDARMEGREYTLTKHEDNIYSK